MPQYLAAGMNSTTSSLMTTIVGSAALPLMITASYPANLSSGANDPPT